MNVDVYFSVPDGEGGSRLLDDVNFSADMANLTIPAAEALRPRLSYAIRTLAMLDDRCEDLIKISRREKTR